MKKMICFLLVGIFCCQKEIKWASTRGWIPGKKTGELFHSVWRYPDEMNTRERWPVSKLGEYYHAAGLYHKLTKSKFEVTYLKAIGFSIEHTNKEGRQVDALVIKKVIQVTASPSLADEYRRLAH